MLQAEAPLTCDRGFHRVYFSDLKQYETCLHVGPGERRTALDLYDLAQRLGPAA